MNEKKSFVIYREWAILLINLPKEQAGELIKAICSYQLGEDIAIKDPSVEAMYQMILPRMQEDAKHYKDVCDLKSKAGKAGMAKRWVKKITDDNRTITDDNRTITDDNRGITKITDNDNDNDNDNEVITNVITNNKAKVSSKHDGNSVSHGQATLVLDYLNKATGRHYRPVKSNTRLIDARLSEGHTLEDFKKVIDTKCYEWLHDARMSQYLRPETLFSASHFESYLNQPLAVKDQKKDLFAFMDEDLTDG